MDSYGDMHIAMNSLMINKWKTLGNYQSRYVPGMIGPFLEVSLLPHTSKMCYSVFAMIWLLTTIYIGIRRNTIPIFFDMMETEFKYRKNFHMVCSLSNFDLSEILLTCRWRQKWLTNLMYSLVVVWGMLNIERCSTKCEHNHACYYPWVFASLTHYRLSERCKGHPVMEREGGMMFIESLAELLRRLMDYRAVQQGDRDLHMHVMFNLLVRN